MPLSDEQAQRMLGRGHECPVCRKRSKKFTVAIAKNLFTKAT